MFHTEELHNMITDNDKYGFIIMDGSQTIFATLCGNDKSILKTLHVNIPKKHCHGGQSQGRMGRNRMNIRKKYLKDVSEMITATYIDNSTNKINVKGIVLAGLAEFKDELSRNSYLDPRIQKSIINIVDVSYGGRRGFSEAIKLSANKLTNLIIVEEQIILEEFFEYIAKETKSNEGVDYVYGADRTLEVLESKLVKKLILWEGTDKDFIRKCEENFEQDIYFVSNKTSEGSQFCKGFGGIGAILKYKIPFTEEEHNGEGDVFDDDDFI